MSERALVCERHRKVERCVVCNRYGTNPAQLCSDCSSRQSLCCICDSEYARYPATVCDSHRGICVRCGRNINEGCVITSACMEAMGLRDDCQELNIFRTFRDEYVRNLPNGEQIIEEYYRVAPSIVAEINKAENFKEIYSALYERLVSRTVELINQGKKEEAFNNCLAIFNELKRVYLKG